MVLYPEKLTYGWTSFRGAGQAGDLDVAKKVEPPLVRIVPTLERIWEGHKLDGWGNFDKTKVCARVFEIAKTDEKYPTEKSLSRFEALLTELYAKTDLSKNEQTGKKPARK